MDKIINNAISKILNNRKELLKIPIRQKAKFEGWLKFELAHYLEKIGMESVEVESKRYFKRDRTDITFFYDGNYYSVELKTSNTNWKIKGVQPRTRPITKNIQSIIEDAEKLNSTQGIVAFVLFPIPFGDNRWTEYLVRIKEKTGLEISKESNCNLITLSLNQNEKCQVIVCTFKSKVFNNWP
jgi:hypothetical protein